MTDDLNTTYQQHIEAQAAATAANKTAVFAALAATDITCVEVEFDGEGDSGGITDIYPYNDRDPVPLPAITVKVQKVSWNAAAPVDSEEPLSEAIEALCYDYLSQEHGGWENNDGGYGMFRFDVAARSIELEFNGRYTDVHTSVHAF